MPAKHIGLTSIVTMAVVTSCLTIIGCHDPSAGGSSENESSSGAASASGLVDQFNNLVVGDLMNVSVLVSMLHAESDLQSRMLDTIRSGMAIYELDALMRSEYSTPLESTPEESFFAVPMSPARLIENEPTRAIAEFVDCHHQTKRLYLIKTDGQWRISLYSLEYDERITKAFQDGTFLGMGLSARRLAQISPSIISRIKANEFYTGKEAKKAIEAAMAQ